MNLPISTICPGFYLLSFIRLKHSARQTVFHWVNHLAEDRQNNPKCQTFYFPIEGNTQMTMPHDRTRALRWAGEFLREIRRLTA